MHWLLWFFAVIGFFTCLFMGGVFIAALIDSHRANKARKNM